MPLRTGPLVLTLLVTVGSTLAAQGTWNDNSTMQLVRRAVDARAHAPANALHDFEARAHGFLFFLAQLGDQGLTEPPRLIRADQLELEVYWKAPGASKQRIIGWRDRIALPTDIVYHRDHLGIVTNGFGDRIRIGEGDEVRGVPHPLAPSGPSLYDYALEDSLTLRLPGRTVRVQAIAFRPKDPSAPRVVGTLYVDADDGSLVRFRFSFTRAAYRDPTLEDITVSLENGLWNGTYWLPRAQELEIRRRTTWLALPARGIIRAQWKIDTYRFDVGLADARFLGPEITSAPPAVRDTFPWSGSLDSAVAAVRGSDETVDLRAVRARVASLAAAHALGGLPRAAFGVGGVSDVIHVNRVGGFTPGIGYVVRPNLTTTLSAWVGYGASDHRALGRLRTSVDHEGVTWSLSVSRVLRDVGDEPVISPILNSMLAQELGDDFGDYVLATRGEAAAEWRIGTYGQVRVAAGIEQTASVSTAATPASGAYRPNPALGAGRIEFGTVHVRTTDASSRRHVAVTVEGGRGQASGDGYMRVRLSGAWAIDAGETEIVASGWAGWASDAVPPDRAFVLGGRGTLVGMPFRAFGGRTAVLGRLEWRIPVPFAAIPLGPYASTGKRIEVAPFVAAGWAARPLTGFPWAATGVRPTFGVAADVIDGLLHLEGGWSPRDHAVGVTADIRRSLWPVL